MRSLLLLTLTLLILIGGFCVYWKLQPATPSVIAHDKQTDIKLPPMAHGDGSLLHAGYEAWFQEFDDVTGRLTRQFRAAEYIPQKDGTVLVKKPEVWFYGANQQQMQVIGTDGEIVMKNPPDLMTKSMDNAPPAPPSRGQLNHVIVNIYSATSAPGVPDEVLTTENIHFDNDTLLITTERFIDAEGSIVPRDQVPVHVRGKYDFDGRGLSMRWNDRDGRLEMLKITHGEQLVVNDTSSITGFSGMEGGGPPRPTTQPSTAQLTTALPIMLASIDQSTAGDAIKTTGSTGPTTRPATRSLRGQPRARTTAATGPTPYLATFNDDVRITQGDSILAVADRMTVDFLTKSDNDKPTTAPTTAPSTGPALSRPSTAAATAGVPASAPSERASATSRPTTAPTTRPAQPPVVIKWTGELTIYPAPANRKAPVTSGSAIIWLFGRPAAILRAIPEQHKRQDVRAASIVYNTGDGSVSLGSSAEAPQVVLKEFADGKPDPTATLISRSIEQFAGQHLAILGGPGRAIVPADDRTPEKGNLDARWARQAKVYLLGGAPGESRDVSIEHMELSGNVDVEHPQLSMQSQELALFFDSEAGATTRPTTRRATQPATSASTQPAREQRQVELKRMFATTAVHARLTDSEGKHQTIDGDELELLTQRGPDGQVHPRQVNAAGKVHAFDDEQDLRTRRLEVTLRPMADANQAPGGRRRAASQPAGPASQPAGAMTRPTAPATQPAEMELEKMLAIGDVIASSKDGSSATGDRLEVTMVDSEPHVRLTSVTGTARVIDAKKNVITGPVITAQTRRQLSHIEGPGSIAASTAEQGGSQDGSQPRKVNLSWHDRADFDGPANSIDAFGSIAFDTIEADGTKIASTSDRVHVDLEAKPVAATQPAGAGRRNNGARPTVAAATMPSTGPATAPAKAAGVAGAMRMDPMGQKQVKQVILDGGAQVTSTLTDDHDGILQRRTITGPTIIYGVRAVDRGASHFVLVPSEGKMLMEDYRDPEKRMANSAGGGGDSGSRGATAFQWKERFVYSEEEHRAEMTRDVLVVYRGAAAKDQSQPMIINASRVLAEFEPAQAKAAIRPSTRATTVASPASRPASRPADPGSAMQVQLVTATGDARNPATVNQGGATLSAIELKFNPQTHWITASGTAANPAVYIPASGGGATRAQYLSWNTVTGDMQVGHASLQGQGK